MPCAPQSQPHPRYLARHVALLVPLLILALAVGGCAWPLSQTSATATRAHTFACAPADTGNQVLRSGSLTVKAPYGDVLRYVNDAVSHPDGDLVSFWTKDVLAPNPELRQYVPSQQALAVTLSYGTPDDFRCVVTDMERANAGQIALEALEHSTVLLSGPPATLDLLPVPIASSDFLLFNYFAGASEPGSIEVLCWEPAPSKRINNATAASRWATYIPATTLHEDLEVTRYSLIGEPAAYATVQAFMVTDGMADSFATAQTHISLPWDHVFASALQEQQIWNQITPNLMDPGNYPQGNAVMLGDRVKGYPPDTGFTFGFRIVQDYLGRHPGTSFASLAGFSTATVYAGSGYTG